MMDGLERAVADGVINRATAQRLAAYLETAPAGADDADPDDEKLRLITGFSDIFVTIGVLMIVGALAYCSLLWGYAVAFAMIAAAAWGLAEFFTRRQRKALPSIVLMVIFVGAVFIAVLGLTAGSGATLSELGRPPPLHVLVASLAAAAAAVAHWLRFHVPITIAAGVAALVALLLALCNMAVPGLLKDHPVPVFLTLGLAVFALAMWFDASDVTRQTRRTDIAFWLHLLAAPIIVHPILMSLVKEGAPLLAAVQVIAVFLCLAAVALAVDRRAILVSSLLYLAYAASELIAAAGMESAAFAVAIFAVGAVVLLLSAAWRPLRRTIVGVLPANLRARLPAVA